MGFWIFGNKIKWTSIYINSLFFDQVTFKRSLFLSFYWQEIKFISLYKQSLSSNLPTIKQARYFNKKLFISYTQKV